LADKKIFGVGKCRVWRLEESEVKKVLTIARVNQCENLIIRDITVERYGPGNKKNKSLIWPIFDCDLNPWVRISLKRNGPCVKILNIYIFINK
jgi:hypothetical protein